MKEITLGQRFDGGVVIAAAPVFGDPDHWHVLLVLPTAAHYLLGRALLKEGEPGKIYTGRRIPALSTAVRAYEKQVWR